MLAQHGRWVEAIAPLFRRVVASSVDNFQTVQKEYENTLTKGRWTRSKERALNELAAVVDRGSEKKRVVVYVVRVCTYMVYVLALPLWLCPASRACPKRVGGGGRERKSTK